MNWVEVEHLPTRKHAVRFDGTNGADIARLIDDPRRAYWTPTTHELVVIMSQGDFVAHPGDYVVLDGADIYPIPADRYHRQYRTIEVGEGS